MLVSEKFCSCSSLPVLLWFSDLTLLPNVATFVEGPCGGKLLLLESSSTGLVLSASGECPNICGAEYRK